MISNSGQTSDLSGIINYATRHSIPLVSLTAGRGSILDKSSTIPLILPEFVEACTITNAPTTSCVIMLALGDALAVALLKKRGFTPSDFFNFHPGGKLGAKMMTVGQVMHRSDALPLVKIETSMKETLLTMSSKGFGIAAVVDEVGFLVGVITDGDLRRHINDLMSKNSGDIASLSPITVVEETFVVDALNLMQDNKISVLIITSAENKPIGILHIQDLLKVGAA